ncbi:ATP-binding protein [Mobilicoccus massiliensis]|uniref:ATP-binding protein n=1 Tax=Mobilicoccus massiliensis TaxID=1522310 RepID=UPI001FEC879C|nr:ATP-binding protein [Mobilicoccus massiliensis]
MTVTDQLPEATTSPVEGTKSVRVPHTTGAVRQARETVAADLKARGVERAVVDEAEAVVSEFVANSVLHARPLADGCVRVRWKVKSGAVEVEVRDGGGSTVPKPVRRSIWAVRGRGLRIVRSMAHEWGVQDERNGRTVWAALGGPSRRRRL